MREPCAFVRRRTTWVVVFTVASAFALALSGCMFEAVQARSESADDGPVSVHQMGGDIDVQHAPRGANLMTMGGNIHLGNVSSYAKLKTMGGNITVDHADGSVDATTMGGIITIGQGSGAITASTMGGDVTARVVGSSADRRDIDLSSKGGTIQLTVPKDFQMDVRITLAYTNNGKDYRIMQHAGLEERETSEWDNSMGTPRKYIRAAGKVGSGLNHVTIRTINGDVILKQE